MRDIEISNRDTSACHVDTPVLSVLNREKRRWRPIILQEQSAGYQEMNLFNPPGMKSHQGFSVCVILIIHYLLTMYTLN